MTDLDRAAGQVMLHCPSCGTREAADPAVLAGSPRIVCRNCGETWPVASGYPSRLALAAPGTAPNSFNQTPEGGGTAFAGDPEALGKAWAAKIESDRDPIPPSRRAPYAALAAGAALFVAIFLGGREVAVAALPDLAGLYATVGLPVNLLGLAIEDVAAERVTTAAGVQLTIRGAIRNVSGADQEVPPLMAEIADAAGVPAGPYRFDAPVQILAAGGAAPFILRVDQPTAEGAAVTVRFRRPSEAGSTIRHDGASQ